MTGDFFLRNFIGRQNVTPAFTYTYAKQLLNKDKVLSETKTELILSIEYCAVLVNTYFANPQSVYYFKGVFRVGDLKMQI